MSKNTERMQVNLIDGSDSDFNDYNNSADVRYSVLQSPHGEGRRPFCQDPFKVATVCLAATCLLLLMILVAVNVHSKGTAQDLQSGSAEAHMLKTCVNVTNLTAELQTLRKDKSDLEKERSQLKDRISKLESRPAATQSTPTQVTAKISCPDNWIYFKSSCYFVSVNRKSWPDSQAYCKSKGGHLAIIHTPEEQTFLWNLLPRAFWNAYWFGITDEKVEEDWHWVDGTKLVGGFWDDGEPNNHNNEDCGYMVKTEVLSRVATKSWYDAPCFMACRWICEKEVDASP